MAKIRVYDSRAFTERYMPSPELAQLLKDDFRKFFIVRVEEMYRLVAAPVPASRSDGHSLIYITEGKAVMTIGSQRYETGRGEVLHVPAGEVFSFGTEDVNKGYLCYFTQTFLPERSPNMENRTHHLRPHRPTDRHLLQLFQRLFYEYSHYGLDRPEILQPYLLALLGEISHIGRAGTPAEQRGVAANAIFVEFRKLVHAQFRTLREVRQYAGLLHISPNHLNKVVRSVSGRSPTKYIDETIISNAKALLRQTSWSIGQVAAEVGLEDASYFARLFRKYEGISPAAFRDGRPTSPTGSVMD